MLMTVSARRQYYDRYPMYAWGMKTLEFILLPFPPLSLDTLNHKTSNLSQIRSSYFLWLEWCLLPSWYRENVYDSS
uniref:Uncharacterized protein n=1 Tax=Rhizophora mucronata TaxID=61149 RepID=A0A2P2PHF6_RHIMU